MTPLDSMLARKIDALPLEPGVYLMKDETGRVIYVGKAKNLRNRVRSYFFGAGDERALIPFLGQAVRDLETVVVDSEKEAFILENELIKRHRPRFNIKLKEGGTFVYLRLDPVQPYPRLEVVRGVKNDGARYFGPYPAARALRETLRIINRHFKLRTCSDHDLSRHIRPCLLCQISRFPQPSVYEIPPERYRHHVDDAIRFLRGKKPELLASLKRQMQEAAAALRFEEAARLRDQIGAVERTLQPQKIKVARKVDQDVFGYHREEGRLGVYILYVRDGRVVGGRSFLAEAQELPDPEVLASAVNLYYLQDQYIPDEVLLPFEIEGMAAVAELLSERRSSGVRVLVPERGEGPGLLRMSTRNARQAVRQPPKGRQEAPEVLERLREELFLAQVPHQMECFDVSHLAGEGLVASKVVMTEGLLDKDRYRRFRIRTVSTPDDYGAMREVIARRLRRGLEEDDLPDLIVLDGGRPQLSAALAAADEVGVSGVEMVALAKSRRYGPSGPGAERLRLPERVFVPGGKEPVVLPQNAPELLLLVRLRDEAHRFAIGYQKKLRHRERVRSGLGAIPGIGTERQRVLLRRFGSLERLARANVEELAAVKGVGARMARRIYEFLHQS